MARVIIDLGTFYKGTAKLSKRNAYINKAVKRAGDGNEVVLTGGAPIWMYLDIAHALHGKAKKLIYSSPVTEQVTKKTKKKIIIFDHSPD